MRTIGTVVRGVRAPIIRQGDDIAQIAADAVMAAWEEAGIKPCDRDVVAVTESVVARAQGNYASVDQIAADPPCCSRALPAAARRSSCCSATPRTKSATTWSTGIVWTRPGSIPTATR